MNENEKKKGVLYIISTPIGNSQDISYRAVYQLNRVDLVVCEEAKIGARILRNYNISKDIETLNEHNEEEKTLELITQLENGKKIALISDCGTPLIADPGLELVKSAIRNNIEIQVIPGASSILTALVRSGFETKQFLFAGFLSRDKATRIKQLKELSKEKRTVILFETPYRLIQFLESASKVMPYRKAYLGCNLTLPYETNHYGTFLELFEKFKNLKFRGEFVVVFEGNHQRDNFFLSKKTNKTKKHSKKIFSKKEQSTKKKNKKNIQSKK